MSLLDVIADLPGADIEAAIRDPRNLGKEAKVASDIISAALPGFSGEIVVLLVSLFVLWVKASGGGTISADPWPEKDAQLEHGGGDLK